MTSKKRAKSALISVFQKEGLKPIVEQLNALNFTLYSTGGTEKFIADLGIAVQPVEDLTNYPSILGGRVKTLHPKVFGGILGRRENNSDLAQLAEYEIPEIDVVLIYIRLKKRSKVMLVNKLLSKKLISVAFHSFAQQLKILKMFCVSLPARNTMIF